MMTDEANKPEERTCANCACMKIETSADNALKKQAFCRRNTPMHGQMRVEVPRLDSKGEVILGKNNKPIMEPATQSVYLFPPTDLRLTCYDGWRPRGTLPGDRWEMDSYRAAMYESLRQLGVDLLDPLPPLSVDEASKTH